MKNHRTRVAIVYDRVNKFGGAERVLMALHALYPDSVLFTSVFDREEAAWVGDWEVRTSFLQAIPFARRHHEWLALLMPCAFASLDLSQFDIVISVTSEFAKNVRTSPQQLHLCYCLTPTRYLWSHSALYGSGVFAPLKNLAFKWLRRIDLAAARKPGAFIAISSLVKDRIEHYYGRSVQAVIFPPTQMPPQHKTIPRTYYLVVSRLVPYKQIDLAIKSCLGLDKPLRIVGIGSDASRLKNLCHGNPLIQFEGALSQASLETLYEGAWALLCPQEEDFGLVSVEAQAHGTPVITLAKSGMAETVIDGKTGILFTSQTVLGLSGAMKQFKTRRWDRKLIMENAAKFDLTAFRLKFTSEVERAWKQKISEVQ